MNAVGQERVDFLVGQGGRVVLDDGPGDVVTVGQPVTGMDAQAVGLVHVRDY